MFDIFCRKNTVLTRFVFEIKITSLSTLEYYLHQPHAQPEYTYFVW